MRLIKALYHHDILSGTEHLPVLVSHIATVVDIGANRGQFALAARVYAPNARIIAFEPLHEPANIFRAVFRNDAQVKLHQAALGNVKGERKFHVSASDDSSSLLPISKFQESLFPGTGMVRTEKVSISPLNKYLKACDIIAPAFLKIDVQGFELEVLRGCESLLSHFSYLYVECSFLELYVGQPLVGEIISWLQKRGWCLKGVHNTIYDRQGNSVQADFLFSNQSS
jgi:FkbM family methyltransferase